MACSRGWKNSSFTVGELAAVDIEVNFAAPPGCQAYLLELSQDLRGFSRRRSFARHRQLRRAADRSKPQNLVSKSTPTWHRCQHRCPFSVNFAATTVQKAYRLTTL